VSVDVKQANYSAPAIAGRVVEFLNNGNAVISIVENNAPATGGASAAIRYQESDNGVDWTDIPDTVATVLPGGDNVATLIQSSRARIALHAGGNVPLSVHVIRTVKGSPSNLGAA